MWKIKQISSVNESVKSSEWRRELTDWREYRAERR